MRKSLFDKVWDLHTVRALPGGETQLLIGLHLIHEVTSPQAFGMLRDLGLKVLMPSRTFATVDHIIPTDSRKRPFGDPLAEGMVKALLDACSEFGITFFDVESGRQGIVHIIGPELGLTQPGMTIACGDSHTSTHGAFGTLAFGIGTTQVRDVLATQCLAMDALKVRRINVNGKLTPGVTAKDVTLYIIQKLGVKGGIGYAYEYGGSVFDNMTIEERMTVCNMAIEGGARVGYVNPDQTTFDYLKGRKYSPTADKWNQALAYWESVASDKDAVFDDLVNFDAADIEPIVTWGITPDQSVGVNDNLPEVSVFSTDEVKTVGWAFKHMDLKPGQPIKGTPINVAFIGSCTNGRISDLREAAKVAKGRKVAKAVRAFVVPGSQQVKAQAEKEGLDKIFTEAGFEWRGAGCSMC